MASGTYADPWVADRDRVRGLIGDTGPSPKFHLSDGELDGILALIGGSGESRVYAACARACRAIAGRRAPAAFSVTGPGLELERDPIFQAWMKLASEFESQAKSAASASAAVLISHEDPDLADIETMTGAAAWKMDRTNPGVGP